MINFFPPSLQGQMVAQGTFSELQCSGVDFTSLLKEDDQNEERQGTSPVPGSVSDLSHAPPDNCLSSMSSLSSSKYSLIEGVEPLVVVSAVFSTVPFLFLDTRGLLFLLSTTREQHILDYSPILMPC